MQAYAISRDDLSTLDILAVTDCYLVHDLDLTERSYVTTGRKIKQKRGDFLLLKDDGKIVHMGIIDSVENANGQNNHTIFMTEMENIFDRKIILQGEDTIKNKGIEDFLVDTINREFAASDDAMSNLDYIMATATTHTKAYASPETEDGGIYNLKTYIGNAREQYGIFLDFEFSRGKLWITANKKEQAVFKFDLGVSDVSKYEEVYSVDALAKLTAVWKIPDREEDGEIITGAAEVLHYYLRTDRTLTTNVDDPQRAAGSEDTIYIQCDTKEEALEQMQNQFAANAYEHSVTARIRSRSKIYPNDELYTGHRCEIKTRSRGVQNSIITTVTRRSNSAYTEVKFGKLPVTLTEKIKKGERKA